MKKSIKNIIKFLLVFTIFLYASDVKGEVINPHKLDASWPISVEEYEISKLVEKLFENFDYRYNNDVHVDSKIIFNMMEYLSVEWGPMYFGNGDRYILLYWKH